MKNDITSVVIKKILTKREILKSKNLVKNPSKKENGIVNSDEIKPIAIHFHIFYTELLPEIHFYMKNITVPYDFYISTSSEEKVSEIKEFFTKNQLGAKNIIVVKVENRGRDIYPFIALLKPVLNNYEIVAHFHSKKTVETPNLGDGWRHYLFDNLFGTDFYFDNLIKYMIENPKAGFMAPPPYYHNIKPYILTMKDKDYLEKIKDVLKKINIEFEDFYTVAKNVKFPAGNMFIARTSAIRQVFESFEASDFPDESGQIENTLQHTIERIWNFVTLWNGYEYYECMRK